MRKSVFAFALILVLSLFVAQDAVAQVYEYRTTGYAYKQKNSAGKWTKWSKWEDSNMKVTINFNTDVVTIDSPKKQIYRITEFLRDFTDKSGGKQVEFSFYDQDGDKGNMRLRIEKNGNSQIYVEFNNIMWVYNVKKTN